MKLLTKEVEALLPKLYSQEHVKDPIVHVKFFDPAGSATWFITEGGWERDENGNPEDFIMFGYVTGMVEDELGYVSMNELQSVKGPLGLGIERDLYWTPKPLSEVKGGKR